MQPPGRSRRLRRKTPGRRPIILLTPTCPRAWLEPRQILVSLARTCYCVRRMSDGNYPKKFLSRSLRVTLRVTNRTPLFAQRTCIATPACQVRNFKGGGICMPRCARHALWPGRLRAAHNLFVVACDQTSALDSCCFSSCLEQVGHDRCSGGDTHGDCRIHQSSGGRTRSTPINERSDGRVPHTLRDSRCFRHFC